MTVRALHVWLNPSPEQCFGMERPARLRTRRQAIFEDPGHARSLTCLCSDVDGLQFTELMNALLDSGQSIIAWRRLSLIERNALRLSVATNVRMLRPDLQPRPASPHKN